MRPLYLLIVGPVVALACNSATLTESSGPTANPNDTALGGDEEDGELPAADGGKKTTTPKKDAGKDSATEPDPVVPDPPLPESDGGGSCPAPAAFGPANVPTGFAAAVKVTIKSIADGDSGDFVFPDGKTYGVRSLYINTEESGGDDPSLVTQFGKDTKVKVRGYYSAAREVKVAVHQKNGADEEDIYHRKLSLIFLDGELLQRRLVREGLTPYYVKFGCAPAPIHTVLLHAESEANEADRGIWTAGPHYDYAAGFEDWGRSCRNNPFKAPYCQ